jgi:hypothetical protein
MLMCPLGPKVDWIMKTAMHCEVEKSCTDSRAHGPGQSYRTWERGDLHVYVCKRAFESHQRSLL